jgi:hypothetical protein
MIVFQRLYWEDPSVQYGKNTNKANKANEDYVGNHNPVDDFQGARGRKSEYRDDKGHYKENYNPSNGAEGVHGCLW